MRLLNIHPASLVASQLRINMLSSAVSMILNTVIMMVTYPLYLHFLGYERYGVWIVLSTVLAFMQLGNLGIGQAVMKLVAEEFGQSNIEGINRHITTAIALLLGSGGTVLAGILLWQTEIIGIFKLSAENARIALALLPAVGVLSLYVLIVQVLNSTLAGLGRMDIQNVSVVIGRVIAACVSALLLVRSGGIEALLIGESVSSVYVHIFSVIRIKRIIGVRLMNIRFLDADHCRKLLGFGGGIMGASVLNILLHPLNKVLISRFVGVTSLPVYEIAFSVSSRIASLFSAGLDVLSPEISRLSKIETIEARERVAYLVNKAGRSILTYGSAIFAVVFLVAEPLLQAWLGPKYTSGILPAFQILLLASFIGLAANPAYHLCIGFGKSNLILAASTVRTVTNMVFIGIALSLAFTTITAIAGVYTLAVACTTVFLLYHERLILCGLNGKRLPLPNLMAL